MSKLLPVVTLALLALVGCAAETSDRSDAPDAPPIVVDVPEVVQQPDAAKPDARIVTVRPVSPEPAGCYPNICWRGLKADGPCSCPEVESACRTQFGEGYEATCPALRSWASSCVSAPALLTGSAKVEADRCYPQDCTELRDDGGHCDCKTVSVACATVYGESYAETCPAFQGWASACVSR